MTRMSRNKGRRAELEVEKHFRERGFDTDRNIGGREQVHGDIACEGMAIEVRRREKLSPETWLADHAMEVPTQLVPALVTRTSNRPWMVCLYLWDFLDLLEEARA